MLNATFKHFLIAQELYFEAILLNDEVYLINQLKINDSLQGICCLSYDGMKSLEFRSIQEWKSILITR